MRVDSDVCVLGTKVIFDSVCRDFAKEEKTQMRNSFFLLLLSVYELKKERQNVHIIPIVV